jgi:pilus assembly protein Flp/PilA
MAERRVTMMDLLKSFWADESGQGLAEYALLLGLIAIVVIAILIILGQRIRNVFSLIASHLSTVPGGA